MGSTLSYTDDSLSSWDDAAIDTASRSQYFPTTTAGVIDQAVVDSLKDVIANASKNLAKLRAMTEASSSPRPKSRSNVQKSSSITRKSSKEVIESTIPVPTATASEESAAKVNQQGTDPPEGDEEAEGPLSFKIPLADLDIAKEAAKDTAQSYWSYRLYKGPEGEEVLLHYCRTLEHSEEVARRFLDQEVLGFDMEWEAWKKEGLKNQISLIQLACEREIALFHVALHEGETVDQLVAPSLRKILESTRILKAGCNVIGADGERLKRYFDIQPRGLFELTQVYKELKHTMGEVVPGQRLNCTLANQVLEHLHLPLCKNNKIRCGRWSKAINQKQSDYAASDAYAGFVLYHVYDWKRRQQQALAESIEAVSEISQVDGADEPRSTVRKRADDILDPILQPLFSMLRARRRDLAAKQSVAPYQIATDRTLKDLARKQPRNMKELKQASGIGEVMANRYGSDWLEVIQEHALADIDSAGVQVSPSKQSISVVPSTPLPRLRPTLQQPTPAPTPIMDPITRPLFSALCGLRIKLSRDLRTEIYSVALDSTLEGLARQRPCTDLDLLHIHGADNFARKAKQHGIDLFAFMQRHTPDVKENRARPVLSEILQPQGSVVPLAGGKGGGDEGVESDSEFSDTDEDGYFETMRYDTSIERESRYF